MGEASEDRAPAGRRWPAVLASVVTGLLVFAAGLVGGYVAASQKSVSADAHGHGHAHGEGDAGHGHAHGPHAPALSARTLANLGVEVGELRSQEFVRSRDVPGVVVAPPGSLLPVSSPVAGVVEEVLVLEGQRVAPGTPVARVRRDAFPRPTLVLTDAVLRPLNEELHSAVATLRSASQAVAIAREDLARVRRVLQAPGAEGALPGRVEIDLRNEERRAVRALENAREEAERHGLTPEEVARVEAGGPAREDLPPVERVLARNGLWSPEASAVLGTLPEETRRSPFAAAVLGELVGSRLLTPRLAEVFRERADLAAAFLDVAGLLQQGATVESLLALADAGALAPVVDLRSPPGVDGDVETVRARAGERVEPGVAVFEVRDLSEVRLLLSPAGPDLAAISAALASGESVTAEPLTKGAGPPLEGLSVLALEAREGNGAAGRAVVPVENRVLSLSRRPDGREFRSWALRPGLRYVARVPVERLPGRFVLPADAVAAQGADTVLLLEDGDSFRPVPVRVEHRDARTVVVGNDGAVFPGDRVVVRGAYAVLLAQQASTGGGVDPHAGHHHE
jgi:multidrug efflux pump subunit AcrA (membrane-fusion protein)